MGQTANAIVKIDGIKVAEMTQATVSNKANGQLIVTADDVIKSRGKATGEVKFDTVYAVGGSRFSVNRAVVEHTWCTVTMQLDGEMLVIEGTFDGSDTKSEVAKGQTDGSHSFSGAIRVITA